MVIISHYKIQNKGNLYKVISKENVRCPKCSCDLISIGTRKRKFIDEFGERTSYIIRRLRCPKCHKIHHELPSIFIPYHLACREFIDKIERGNFDEIPLETETIRRLAIWWKCFKKYTKCINTIEIKDKVNRQEIPNDAFRYRKIFSFFNGK